MSANRIVEIKLSRTKNALMFLGAVGFVAIGIWFMVAPPQTRNVVMSNPVMLFVLGLLSVVFFGFCAVFIGYKLFDQGPGLTLKPEGFIDRSSASALGLVYWADVVGIAQVQMGKQRFVAVHLADPQAYLNAGTFWLSRNIAKMNYTQYGTPVFISAHSLAISFEELEKLMLRYLSDYRKTGQAAAGSNPNIPLA